MKLRIQSTCPRGTLGFTGMTRPLLLGFALSALSSTHTAAQSDVATRDTTATEAHGGWRENFSGQWKTVVSGHCDKLTTEALQGIINKIRGRSRSASSDHRAAADRWTENFEKWIEGATNSIIRNASSHTQKEDFIIDGDQFYQVNTHGGGYEEADSPPDPLSGVSQIWRNGEWFVSRKTYSGCDDQFALFADAPQHLTTPRYASLALDLSLLSAFVRANGSPTDGGNGSITYSGPTPVIQGVFYPAWYDIGPSTLVLRDAHTTTTSIESVLSMKDQSGSVLQETRATIVDGVVQDIQRRVYYPESNLIYSGVRIKLLQHTPGVAGMVDFKHLANFPKPADVIIDKRYHNFEIPIEIALAGNSSILAYLGIQPHDVTPQEPTTRENKSQPPKRPGNAPQSATPRSGEPPTPSDPTPRSK